MTMVPDSVRQLLPLAGAAEDVALVQDGRSLTYAGLAAAIRDEAARLTRGGPR